MRLIDGDKLRARACEIFLCAEPGSAEERRFAFVLGLIDSEPTIAPPPNDPLTLEELREMDGEPVWCARWGVWGLVDIGFSAVITRKGDLDINDEGIHERLYRRKPEEEII